MTHCRFCNAPLSPGVIPGVCPRCGEPLTRQSNAPGSENRPAKLRPNRWPVGLILAAALACILLTLRPRGTPPAAPEDPSDFSHPPQSHPLLPGLPGGVDCVGVLRSPRELLQSLGLLESWNGLMASTGLRGDAVAGVALALRLNPLGLFLEIHTSADVDLTQLLQPIQHRSSREGGASLFEVTTSAAGLNPVLEQPRPRLICVSLTREDALEWARSRAASRSQLRPELHQLLDQVPPASTNWLILQRGHWDDVLGGLRLLPALKRRAGELELLAGLREGVLWLDGEGAELELRWKDEGAATIVHQRLDRPEITREGSRLRGMADLPGLARLWSGQSAAKAP